MVQFIKTWNRFFFTPTINIFDLIVIISVISLMTNYSWWWALIYIPSTFISTIMQRIVEKEND